jgi:TRAP-type C4-dicarboxylate transport system substrate-binding protein
MTGKRFSLSRRAALAGGLATLAAPAVHAQTPVTMKIGMVTINDPQHTLSVRFAEEIEKRTSGRIKGQIFPAGQLGKLPRQMEGLQFGSQEVLICPPSFLAGVNPALQITDAPGFFRDMEHAHAVVSRPKFHDMFLDLAKAKGIQGVGLCVYGPTTVATIKPAKTIADLKAMKVRILATDLERATVEAMGMSGVPMDFTEVLQAFQNGTLDAVRTSMVVMGGMKFYNTAKFVVKEQTGMILIGIWVSQSWLNGLPADLKKTVADTARELERWGTDNSIAFEARSEKEWRDAGVTVSDLPPDQKKALFDTVKPVGEKVLGANPRTAEAWKALQAAAGEVS